MLDWRVARRRLLIAVGVVAALGLAIEALHAQLNNDLVEVLLDKLSLSYEANLPTIVSAALLFSCAVAAGAIALARPPHHRQWWVMAAIAAYLSLDEAVEIHEHLGGLIGTSGVLYFDWVIPAAVVVVALVIAFIPFIRALPATTRTRLLIAGAIYVGGALVMELPLGWWTEHHGADNFGYALIDWFEETMEMVGVVLALAALLAHRASLGAEARAAARLQDRPPATSARSPYIVSEAFDWVFFLGSPMWALSLGILVSGTSLATDSWQLAGEHDTLVGFFIGTVIHAHLVAVFFRSHGNPAIRRLYPVRFFVVPVLLWLAIVASSWMVAIVTVVATFWDVWHSGAQTFGFARIYERNHGTPADLGRRLDFWLQQLMYAGPILAGATLMDHVDSFGSFERVGSAFFTSIPAEVEGHARYLTYAVVGVGTLLVAAYVIVYARLAKRGDYRPCWLKIWLVASTSFVSIYTWAFNSWGQAFLIMNLFHGVQYLALVWAMEGKRIQALMRLPRRPRLALAIYVGSVLAYGLGVQALDSDLTALWAITMVVSLMHFWYDAFVWSVRRAEV